MNALRTLSVIFVPIITICCSTVARADTIEVVPTFSSADLIDPFDWRRWTFDDAIDLTAVNTGGGQRLTYDSSTDRLMYISTGPLQTNFGLTSSETFNGIFAWSASIDWESGFLGSGQATLLGDLGSESLRVLAEGEVTGVGFDTGVVLFEGIHEYAWLLAEIQMNFVDDTVAVLGDRWGFFMPVSNYVNPEAPFTYDFDCSGYLRTCAFGSQMSETGVFRVVPVSEPGTFALLTIGLFGMGLSRRRKQLT